jgi:succinoglycan biosynthesis transport protein ExoP
MMNGSSVNAEQDFSSIKLNDLIDIFLRRKWIIIAVFIIGTVLTVVYTSSLADIYRSSTLILVEPQKIPSSYVMTTVTTGVDERLNTIRQQIMSRKNLEQIIQDFDLYDELTESLFDTPLYRLMKLVQNVLDRVGIHYMDVFSIRSQQRHNELLSALVQYMRGQIEVNVVGRGNNKAFTVAYSGRVPTTVMKVTESLSSFFIEENLKSRTRQAEATTEFLDEQLAKSRQDLGRQELKLKSFKEQHMGILPSQLGANLQKLDRLQSELTDINNMISATNEKIVSYESSLIKEPNDSNIPLLGSLPNPKKAKVESLQEDLARLRGRFQDNYPDIIMLKNQIHELETQIVSGDTSNESPQQVQEERQKGPDELKRAQIEAQLQVLRSNLSSLDSRKKRTQQLIDEYEQKVEATFENEQALVDLTRNYDTSRKNYQDLLTKKLNAQLSENLEKQQQAEQFRIIDPPYLPLMPDKPNRPKMILLGSMLSGLIGLVYSFLREYFNPSVFRKPEDLQSTFSVPLLVSISRSKPLQEAQRRVALANTNSIVAEQYRVLFTRLDNKRDLSQNIFAISSSIPQEGKTVTALNLAVVTARDFGKKILLLEADFKKPGLTPYLKGERHIGLVDILRDQTNGHSPQLSFTHTLGSYTDENLSILPAGEGEWNSSSLLSSYRMKELLEIWRHQYDIILIDAPPILPLSDMNILCKLVDGIILVVRAERTPTEKVEEAIKMLETDKIVGFVFNDVQNKHKNYYDKRTKKRAQLARLH